MLHRSAKEAFSTPPAPQMKPSTAVIPEGSVDMAASPTVSWLWYENSGFGMRILVCCGDRGPLVGSRSPCLCRNPGGEGLADRKQRPGQDARKDSLEHQGLRGGCGRGRGHGFAMAGLLHEQVRTSCLDIGINIICQHFDEV